MIKIKESASRSQLLEALDQVINELSTSHFFEAIDEIYLLGSLISKKIQPNDIDLMIIGSFSINNQSILRSQQSIREHIIKTSNELYQIDFSINFGESIESIQFQDGTALESYLLIYSKEQVINWKYWFDTSGMFQMKIIEHLGIIDTHVLRFDYPGSSNYLKLVPSEGELTKLESLALPKEAIWTFMNKRLNVPYPKDKWQLFHPPEWRECNRCGNCCNNFEKLRSRFSSSIPQIYDIIKSKFNNKLWNTIEITSEAMWFWIVEEGLNQYQIKEINDENNSNEVISCPFWQKPKNEKDVSTCIIYDDRPDACRQFPEYKEDLIEFDCITKIISN